jgi:hypothetical protein
LISRERNPEVTDPMPSALEAIRAELDYWEVHLYDGDPGSKWWEQVQARIEGLRHRENRLLSVQPTVTNNLIGPNSRINHNSVDQSVNLVTHGRSADQQAGDRDPDSSINRPRFRDGDEPLGVFWSQIPSYIKKAPVTDIYLAAGPAIWLRVGPAAESHVDLSLPTVVRQRLMSDGKLWLSPLDWGDIGFIRAEDGFGVYSRFSEGDSATNSVAFVFETGEIWAIDTGLLAATSDIVYFGDVQKAMCSRLLLYRQFMRNLGIEPPLRWTAGLDGIKGRRLNVQHPEQGISRLGDVFLKDQIVCRGSYDGLQKPHLVLAPFFREVFKRSSMEYPSYLQS